MKKVEKKSNHVPIFSSIFNPFNDMSILSNVTNCRTSVTFNTLDRLACVAGGVKSLSARGIGRKLAVAIPPPELLTPREQNRQLSRFYTSKQLR